ncbi:MAG: tetratricopeptide repeat protein [Planctomycetes bacterium]|nr:tetratricopeptide repeat protein [Planctomycetota bacterium]MBI3848340.1 tetratricopeptide repeat protein [Planctomycetota bacterium]
MPTNTCSSCGTNFDLRFKFCPNCGATLTGTSPQTHSLAGKVMRGKYRLVRKVGEGSMGTVYEAEHVQLHKRVAVKVLHPDLYLSEEALNRFQQEGIAAGRFNHPNAIQIFDFDKGEDDTVYLAMEYVDGRTLRDIIHQDGALPIARAVSIIEQVLRAVGEAHRQGIVHRDLKPDNIMVLPEHEGEDSVTVKVLDFGMAKIKDYSETLRTQAGRIMGTPLYMSPEQTKGDAADRRSDIYAVGLVLYEALTGRPAFQGKSVTEILLKQGSEKPVPPSQKRPDLAITRDVDRVVMKALSKNPDQRCQSAEEMLDELLAATGVEAAAASPRLARRERTVSMAPPKRRRGPMIWIVAGVGAVVVVVAALVLSASGRGSGAHATRVSLKPERSRSSAEAQYVSLLGEASRHLKARRYNDALEALKSALDSPVKDAEGYYLRGQAFLGKKDRTTATADFQEASRLDPTYAEPHDALGVLALDDGKFGEAGTELQKAIELNPNLAEPHLHRGRALSNLGNQTEAEKEVREALRCDPSSAPAHATLADLQLRQGQRDEAIKSLTQAKRHDPLWAAPRESLGDLYTRLGRTDDALREYDEAFSLSPKQATLALKLGMTQQALQKSTDATKSFRAAVEADAASFDAHLVLGAELAEEKSFDEATKELERAVQLQPKSARALCTLGDVLRAQGKHDDAARRYREAFDADDKSPLAARNLGFLAFEAQNYDEALSMLETARERADDRPMTYYALGILYMDYFPDTVQSTECFQKYRDLGGTDPQVARWMAEIRDR